MLPRLLAIACLVPATTLLADPPKPLSIRDLAPESSAIVVGGEQLAAVAARFRETPLWALWNHEQIQEALRPALRELRDRSEEAARELGRPEATFAMPASFGLAVASELDEELGINVPVVIGFIDWGSEGEMVQLVEALLDRAERDGQIRRDDLRGRPMRVVPLADPDARPGGMMPGLGPIAPFDMEGVETLYMVLDGNRHFMASGTAVLEDLLAAAGGRGGRAIGESRDFLDTIDLLEQPDLYAMLLTANLQRLLASGEAAMFLAIGQPVIARVFGDIRAHAVGVRVGQDGAMLEQSIATTVPGRKAGLLSLFTLEGPAEAPPAGMLPADAYGYGRMNIRFAEIMPTVREIVAGLDAMMRDEVEGMLMQMGPMLDNAFRAMSPTMHVYSSMRMPLDVDSFETVMAIPVADATAVEPLVAMAAPGMGLRRRDFQGHTIYSDEFSPMAVGLGKGMLLMGPATGVEQALRGGDPAEGASREMRTAIDSLGDRRVVGFGYTDLIATLRQQQELLRDMDGLRMPGPGLPGVEIGEIDWQRVLDPELWKQFVGPGVWDLTLVEKGFLTRSRLLPPAN